MTHVGRWIVSLLFGLVGLAQILMGAAVLLGLTKPETTGITLPPEHQALLVPLAGTVAILVGLFVLLIAWALFTWRRWGRLVAIALCLYELLFLVIAPFLAPLTLDVIIPAAASFLILFWLFHPGVKSAFAARGRLA